MREQVYAWLVRYLSSEEENSKDKKMTPKDIQQLLKNENATLFLMIWSIMEQKIFDGFMKKKGYRYGCRVLYWVLSRTGYK